VGQLSRPSRRSMCRQRRPPITGAEGELWPGELDPGRSALHPVVLRSPRRAGDQRRAVKRHDPLQSRPARRGTGRRRPGVFLAPLGLFGVGCGAIARRSAGGVAAYVPATFVS